MGKPVRIAINKKGILGEEDALALKEEYKESLNELDKPVVFVIGTEVSRTLPTFWDALVKEYAELIIDGVQNTSRREDQINLMSRLKSGQKGFDKFSLEFSREEQGNMTPISEREILIEHRFWGIVLSYWAIAHAAAKESRNLKPKGRSYAP